MKLSANELGGIITLPGGTLSIGFEDAENEHTVEFSLKAQNQLLLGLLAAPEVQSGTTPLKRFRPRAVKVMSTSTGNIGLSLFLQDQIAIHISLPKELADDLQRQLAMLDKPAQTQ